MNRESVFEDVLAHCETLGRVLKSLDGTLADVGEVADRPHLVDQLGRAVGDAHDRVHAATALAGRLGSRDGASSDLPRLRTALRDCHLEFLGVDELCAKELTGNTQLRHLIELEWESAAWEEWARLVIDDLGRCRDALRGWGAALLRCWSELADRLGSSYAQATATGQQITIESTETKEWGTLT